VYQQGDRVYLRDPRPHPPATKTFAYPYQGLWQVIERLGDTTYRVQPEGKKGPIVVTHFARMKPAHSDPKIEQSVLPASPLTVRISPRKERIGIGPVTTDDANEIAHDPTARAQTQRAADTMDADDENPVSNPFEDIGYKPPSPMPDDIPDGPATTAIQR